MSEHSVNPFRLLKTDSPDCFILTHSEFARDQFGVEIWAERDAEQLAITRAVSLLNRLNGVAMRDVPEAEMGE